MIAELVPQFGVDEIFWIHENPVTSERMVTAWCGIEVRRLNQDPLGNAVENYSYANTCWSSEPDPSQELFQTNWDAMYGDISNSSTGCYVDGIESSCNTASKLMNIGVGVELPPGLSGDRFQLASNGGNFQLAILYPRGDGLRAQVITSQEGNRGNLPVLARFDPNRPRDPDLEPPVSFNVSVGRSLMFFPGHAAGPVPQNTFSQSSSSQGNTDPCAHFLPANVPPNVSVDKNIAFAEGLYDQWSLKGQSEPSSRAASASMLNYNRPEWFKQQTGDHGPMDYKYLTTDMRYDNFGNFNYGAVGAAIHYSGDTLLRVAGWIQQHGNYAYLGEGTAPSTFLAALSGAGGKYPYGDKPGDAVQVQNGHETSDSCSVPMCRSAGLGMLVHY